MKILHTVEFYPPSIGGSQEVVRQLSEHMVALGHEVTVATSKLPDRTFKTLKGVKIKEFAIKGNLVRGIEGEIDQYQDFLVDSDFDVVMNYAAQQWATDLSFEVLDKIKAKKIIVPCGYSGLQLPEYQKYFQQLPKYLRKYHASVYLSNTYQDISFARKHRLKKLHVIPNGVDVKEFSSIDENEVNKIKDYWLNKTKAKYLAVTIGNHTGSKGHHQTHELVNKLSSSMGGICHLTIGGFKQRRGCHFTCRLDSGMSKLKKPFGGASIYNLDSLSRRDTILTLAAADAFVFLSNIEASPLVLFETCAAGTPFVATAVGNSQEIADWTKGGLICKTTTNDKGEKFAQIADAQKQLKQLLSDKKTRNRLARAGHKQVLDGFTWAKITKQYLDLYLHA